MVVRQPTNIPLYLKGLHIRNARKSDVLVSFAGLTYLEEHMHVNTRDFHLSLPYA